VIDMQTLNTGEN